jgi:putative hydrolase of the HAD superfamily
MFMPRKLFSHVTCWVFDLDHTLYPPSASLFGQIEDLMTGYIQKYMDIQRAEADALRHRYWQDHGTTLRGMIDRHGMEPGAFLDHVHKVDLSMLTPDPQLADHITALPGRRVVFTNSPEGYAHDVLAARGLTGVFDAVYGTETTQYHAKPARRAFDHVIEVEEITPQSAAMFEDDPRNLVVPHDLGMRTVHVADQAEQAPHIHHHTDDLTGFLGALLA